ncbi:hypothetical protein UFOVP1271_20 [uncultured Caudovirales phage]|uniref:Uncharacterized protein n=1 Tax=uncultured Caudovirales phage TaxID=2100421 RepID=A0A6J5RM29_9CAUD|nr:hypothetical protein UFOVP1271_20 [uncultured Caudovirales phage]
MTMEVQGLESTLKALQKIQPEVKKQFFADAKQIVRPAIDEAKNAYQTDYLSGMSRAWAPGGRPLFPWSQPKASKGVAVATSLSKKQDAVLTIIQKDAAAAIFDMAGKKTSNPLGNALNAFQTPSRVMWRSYEQHAGDIEKEMTKSVDEVMGRISAITKMVIL